MTRAFPSGRSCRRCRPASSQRLDVRPAVVVVLLLVALIAVLGLVSLLLI